MTLFSGWVVDRETSEDPLQQAGDEKNRASRRRWRGRLLPGPARSSRSILSRCSHAILSICILLVLVVGAGFVILRSGVDSNLLRDEAQKSLTHILGEGASASIGSAALSLDQDSHVALEARDVSISDPKQGVEISGIKSVRLGLAPLPL